MSRLVLAEALGEARHSSPTGADFSSSKTLYEYQYEALLKADMLLALFYGECRGDRDCMYERFYRGSVPEWYEVKVRGRVKEEWQRNFELDGKGRVAFKELVNRAGFWMATGSGKTLVIVKLTELLESLMREGTIPRKDILFLTARDDLVEQFLRHVEEYNSYTANPYRIRAVPLSEFEKEKRDPLRLYQDEVAVFYYRSDLITEESGEKRIGYQTVDNDGNWYLILDEAHKGDKAESKSQAIFTLLSRNGFMFNFSATFVDELDLWTCAYRYNLENLVKDGYGKRIYVSARGVEGFDRKKDFPEEAKTKTVLKAILHHVWLCRIKKDLGPYYPGPLLVVLAHSVNTDDSDLELFFRELAQIAGGHVRQSMLYSIKRELKQELYAVRCVFDEKAGLDAQVVDLIDQITYQDILEEFFNASGPADIEVRVLSENRQELAFALKSSSKPFALLKIGDISQWLKGKLSGYEVVERFEEESYFRNIDQTDINLLMGSRAFYEGWDSPRPSVMLYINIGRQDARKFVLQSAGRGVRVMPFEGLRRRIDSIEEKPQIDLEKAKALEFLYLYGTKARALREIVDTLRAEKMQGRKAGQSPGRKPTAGQRQIAISPQDYELLKKYLECVPGVVFVLRHRTKPSVYRRLLREAEGGDLFRVEDGYPSSGNVGVVVRKALNLLEGDRMNSPALRAFQQNNP